MLDRIKRSLRYRWRGLRQAHQRRKAARARAEAVALLRLKPLRPSDQHPFTLALLAGRKSFDDLLLALWSLERVLGGLGPVVILSDGTLDDCDAAFLAGWHPGSLLFRDVDELAARFGYTIPPALRRFVGSYFAAPKLLLAAAVQSVHPCLLMDSDVVFFRNPLGDQEALSHCIALARPACLQDELESCDPVIIEHAWRRSGLKVSRIVNSGLVYLPAGALNAVDWDGLLPEISYVWPGIFAEQTALAAALAPMPYDFLPPDKFVVSLRGAAFPPEGVGYEPFSDATDYEAIVCRHFVTPVRHLMWLTAFSKLAARGA